MKQRPKHTYTHTHTHTHTYRYRNNETKSLFSEKINKIDKLLVNLTKMRREKTQINKITNKKGKITTNTKEIQGIIRDYFENYSQSRRNGHISRYI
jgi:transcriptional accessory protein Tex/SPT6